MKSKKILTVVGARPQFVKAAVVSRALTALSGWNELLVHTGQHYDRNMSDRFFEELGLAPPAYNLGIGGGSHAVNTGRAMEGLERLINEEKPAAVLVYGDTDATLAGALAAAKLLVPVVHVEAGLRSYNRAMPEEVNRVLTDHVASLLLAPSELAVENLRKEGIEGNHVRLTGDVMFDAVRIFGPLASRSSTILSVLALDRKAFILATVHRKENTDNPDRLGSIMEALGNAPLPVVLPLHPRTKRKLADFGIELPANIRLTEPLGYFDMMVLEGSAKVVATDSGGVQKEAYFNGTPCVILRDETEWPELVEIGANRLTGVQAQVILAGFAAVPTAVPSALVYGTGDAADQVAAAVDEMFK